LPKPGPVVYSILEKKERLNDLGDPDEIAVTFSCLFRTSGFGVLSALDLRTFYSATAGGEGGQGLLFWHWQLNFARGKRQ
jgi:hypothetical protein